MKILSFLNESHLIQGKNPPVYKKIVPDSRIHKIDKAKEVINELRDNDMER